MIYHSVSLASLVMVDVVTRLLVAIFPLMGQFMVDGLRQIMLGFEAVGIGAFTAFSRWFQNSAHSIFASVAGRVMQRFRVQAHGKCYRSRWHLLVLAGGIYVFSRKRLDTFSTVEVRLESEEVGECVMHVGML